MTAGSRETFAPVRAFLAVRRARHVLVGTILLGVLAAAVGTYETSLPSVGDVGQSTIQLWRMMALGAATLPVLGMRSHLADLEQPVTRRLRRFQRGYLAATSVGGALLYLGFAAVTLPTAVLVTSARSWAAWYGLALLAGVVLGWRLAWTLPGLVAVILWYWGKADGQYAWWEFTARVPDDLRTFALCVGLLCVGLAAYWLTPWRRAALRLHIMGGRKVGRR